MRKVTNKVVDTFLAGRNGKFGNSESRDGKLLLHGNTIAEVMPDGSIMATLAGWPTVTTRERLNGLCQAIGLSEQFRQSRFVQFYGSRPVGPMDTIVLVRPDGKAVTGG